MTQINLLVLNYSQGNDISKIFVSDSDIVYTTHYLDPDANITKNLLQFINQHQTEYTFITSNKIISNLQGSLFNSYIKQLILNNDGNQYLFGVCYVSKWMDKCLTYGSQFQLSDTGTTVVRTQGPKGFTTILISPAGATALSKYLATIDSNPIMPIFNDLISRDILANKITAISFTESLISYDPLKATSSSDFIQTTECESSEKTIDSNSVGNIYLMWFFLLVMLILVLAFFIFKFSPFFNSSLDEYPVMTNKIFVN